ncbi:bifunctional diaminohydroxyphosphoribosylaminopyrimidine deaminase/5-amino-6-(5-phosphoribosylamino)uracil reductase RibD [Ascidiimonas aurantiaca]|uniref:bifunctional diaminohydroxyphosphoribosylaminopyrimidine deaminase/5-amino-6-(5-phosphoribosylamino)uracil reductase RibD n=1 Tax=Ascidiimonas aurantiaca TaxID=1685432 RepID=UPI0030EDAB25
MNIHEKYINRCIQLAKNGLGTTYPNPMVGSVILHKGLIIGEGWHKKAGDPHAEVAAIQSVKDKTLLKEATLYVNLEPCSHYGKTPPCSDLIIREGIKKIVIGSMDPHSKVAGKGIKKLKDHGCEVIIGVLEEHCHELNKRFFTFHLKQRPYIILKWARTKDGYLSPHARNGNSHTPRGAVWITNSLSRQWVHKWRSEESAILAGTRTVLEDNPSLTTRNWHGTSPIRVVIDEKGAINTESFQVFDKNAQTLLITGKETHTHVPSHIKRASINFQQNPALQICKVLYEMEIQSCIIEGGAHTLNLFINENIWDEARVFTGDTVFGHGTTAPRISGTLLKKLHLLNDELTIWHNPQS